MKTVKFYYSKPVHVRTVQIITDAQGEPMFIYPNTSQVIKTLPRITVASVYDPKENTMSFGIAVCSPKDAFKKATGRKLAEDRGRIHPNIRVVNIKKGCIRSVSKKYANQLISDYITKDVRFDF